MSARLNCRCCGTTARSASRVRGAGPLTFNGQRCASTDLTPIDQLGRPKPSHSWHPQRPLPPTANPTIQPMPDSPTKSKPIRSPRPSPARPKKRHGAQGARDSGDDDEDFRADDDGMRCLPADGDKDLSAEVHLSGWTSDLLSQHLAAGGVGSVVVAAAAEMKEEGEAVSEVRCDKCGEKHETALCPSYSKPRDKHPDAQKSKMQEVGGSGGNMYVLLPLLLLLHYCHCHCCCCCYCRCRRPAGTTGTTCRRAAATATAHPPLFHSPGTCCAPSRKTAGETGRVCSGPWATGSSSSSLPGSTNPFR